MKQTWNAKNYPNMINSAKSLGLDARLLDGQELNFNSEFDAVFSNAALDKTLEKRGIDLNSINPWYFPSVEDYRARLESRGFKINKIAIVPRPTLLPTGMRGWLATFANPFTAQFPISERDAFLDEVIASLEPSLCDASGNWFADYVRLRFSASKQ